MRSRGDEKCHLSTGRIQQLIRCKHIKIKRKRSELTLIRLRRHGRNVDRDDDIVSGWLPNPGRHARVRPFHMDLASGVLRMHGELDGDFYFLGEIKIGHVYSPNSWLMMVSRIFCQFFFW